MEIADCSTRYSRSSLVNFGTPGRVSVPALNPHRHREQAGPDASPDSLSAPSWPFQGRAISCYTPHPAVTPKKRSHWWPKSTSFHHCCFLCISQCFNREAVRHDKLPHLASRCKPTPILRPEQQKTVKFASRALRLRLTDPGQRYGGVEPAPYTSANPTMSMGDDCVSRQRSIESQSRAVGKRAAAATCTRMKRQHTTPPPRDSG